MRDSRHSRSLVLSTFATLPRRRDQESSNLAGMSESDSAAFILAGPTAASDVVHVLRQYFVEVGAPFGADFVVFNDVGEQEQEPVDVASEEAAWQQLLAWPGLGGLTYRLPHQRVSVFLHGRNARVDYVILSVRSYVPGDEAERAFHHLTEQLHERLHAARSIVKYMLLDGSFPIGEEVERVRAGVFAGEYEKDLRQPPR
jgi:hypothetical protein